MPHLTVRLNYVIFVSLKELITLHFLTDKKTAFRCCDLLAVFVYSELVVIVQSGVKLNLLSLSDLEGFFMQSTAGLELKM